MEKYGYSITRYGGEAKSVKLWPEYAIAHAITARTISSHHVPLESRISQAVYTKNINRQHNSKGKCKHGQPAKKKVVNSQIVNNYASHNWLPFSCDYYKYFVTVIVYYHSAYFNGLSFLLAKGNRKRWVMLTRCKTNRFHRIRNFPCDWS